MSTDSDVEQMFAAIVGSFLDTDNDWWATRPTEFAVRDGLAGALHVAGFGVFTEVVLGQFGRVDLIAIGGAGIYIVEVKLAITSPSELRAAIQQVHGYRTIYCATTDTDPSLIHAVVVAGDLWVSCTAWSDLFGVDVVDAATFLQAVIAADRAAGG